MRHPHGDGMTPAEQNKAYLYRSKVDRLEGQVEALIEATQSQAKKIEKLEKEIGNFRGLKGLASSLR